MRTIKFRAWDEQNKVMHFDFQFIKSGDEGNDWIIFISDKFPLSKHETNPFTNPNPYFSQQLKIMQFTGLLDKNGVEIFEGDIVKMPFHYEDKEFFIVEWQKEDARWWAGDFYHYDWDLKDICEWKNSEVVGNKFEHPNLLK